MTKVIGVRFRKAGKIYFFSPGKLEIQRGDQVIVETARGVEFGNVVSGPKEVEDGDITQPLKSVIRVATDEDRKTEEKNRKKEREAFDICLEKIHKHGLEMKLIDAEYSAPELNCVRLEYVTRQRFAAVSVYVAENFAVIRICRSLHRFRLRWQRNRTCL